MKTNNHGQSLDSSKVDKCYIIKTHKSNSIYVKPHFFVLNKGMNSGKPSKEPFANSFVILFKSEEDRETIFWITYSLWKSKFWHRDLVGSVIPFLRITDFLKEFSAKTTKILHDFEQHKKEVQALRLLENNENQLNRNIKLINELRSAIIHRLCN